MKINLVLIQPPGFEKHSALFDELIQLYQAHIRDLGVSSNRTVNKFKGDALNIVFGYNNLGGLPEKLLSLNYIICQHELLGFESGWNINSKDFFRKAGLPLLRNAVQVWDFAVENIRVLQSYGIHRLIF